MLHGFICGTELHVLLSVVPFIWVSVCQGLYLRVVK